MQASGREPESAQAGERAYVIERMRPDRMPGCAALLDTIFGGGIPLWLDRIDHWERNPHLGPDMPRGWTATASDGSLAGFMANSPFAYVEPGGGRLYGFAAHSLAVLPEAREAGVARRLVKAEFLEPCDFSLGSQLSPGGWAASLAGGGLAFEQPWMSDARIVAADFGALARLGAKGPAALRAAAAAAANVAGRVAGAVERPVRGIDVEPIEAFDPIDDEALGRMVTRKLPIRPLRDAETLNWLYFGTPHLRRSRLVLAARRDGRLVGYAGLRRLPGWLVLLECRALPEETMAMKALIGSAQRWAKRERMSHILVYRVSDALGDALPRLATFRAPDHVRYPYLLVVKRPGLTADQLEIGPWDGDAIIADDAPALDQAPRV
jgi:hypothetical protein